MRSDVCFDLCFSFKVYNDGRLFQGYLITIHIKEDPYGIKDLYENDTED